MKRYRFIFFFLLFFAFSCKQKDKEVTPASENNIDAARNFIRAALDGKFTEARRYLLQDSININYLDVAERSYQRADQETKNGYRSASINIVRLTEPIKDSVSVLIFSNSFKNDQDTLKLVRFNNQWLVDLKYLYLHGSDSVDVKIPNQENK